MIAYRVSYSDGRSPSHCIATYNWTDAPKDIQVHLSDVQLSMHTTRLLPNNRFKAQIADGDDELTVFQQPPHSMRVVELQDMPAAQGSKEPLGP